MSVEEDTMFIRLLAFTICQTAIIATALVIYDLPGWSLMTSEVKLIITSVGAVATLILLFLTLVSEEKIIQSSEARRWQSIDQRLR